ncbi:hypothetical protein CLV84_2460 [Neolewinella xylanilytica]|uniref:TspO/MBR related protein n=1 Tax=Neolewinella xylanilytica TaxID=1514080 RepID=A0A2S6I3B3_9BACT|nr:hypothetical protein [Neolewinella xylanilytica]PPK85559.1 hypothetical protein CLV84_2460 [Neolewinella xylanilytica]
MPDSSSVRNWRIALLLTFLLVPIANYLPILLDVSQDRFTNGTDTRVDAAGYAFSIWGVIFTGMILFAAFQFRAGAPPAALLRAYRFLVLAGWASIAFVPISLGSNYLWGAFDLLWHLVALLGAYTALREHGRSVGRPAYAWTYFAPSLYLGWISAATVISLTLALQQLGVSFSADTEILIATLLVVILTGLGLYLTSRADGFYGLTVAWALVAIAVKQQDASLILWAASAGATIVAGLALYRLVSARRFFYAFSPG